MAKPKITAEEKAALIRVRDGLRAGKYVHARSADKRSKKPRFDMGTTGLFKQGKHGCGSVACIGGWVHKELGRTGGASTWAYTKAAALCYPDVINDWSGITPKEAANAIDNFLKDGKPRWKAVIASA